MIGKDGLREGRVRDQFITERYAIYNGDCCEVTKGIPDESVGFSMFSPPFFDLYSYSDDNQDMGNAKDYDNFFEHFGFLIKELARVIMPGRIVAVHCMDLPTHKRNGDEIGLREFPEDIITGFKKEKFIFHSRHVIWKDPLIAATRSHAVGLAHQQIVKDSAMCRMGIADQILAFRKPGVNPKPIRNQDGLTIYHGENSIPHELSRWEGFQGNQKENKRSQWIWQQFASPVWSDIRQTYVLPYREGREEEDEKHICPLALDVVERCVALWSAKDDVVFTPFMGIGTEVYVAVKNGRKGCGVELKRKYYTTARSHLKALERKMKSILDD